MRHGGRCKKNRTPDGGVHVVDRHHGRGSFPARATRRVRDAVPAIAAAVTDAPAAHALVHFGSHPDLACLGEATPRAVLRSLAAGRLDPAKVRAHCHVASWILPLVLAGRVDEVVWISVWWCRQMEAGTYALRVGLENGRMKVGAADAERTAATAGCGPRSVR